MNSINRTDKSLHLKCSWKLPQVDVSIPGFCPGVAEPRLGVFGRREGVPGNAAAGSTLRVLWINGTQTCREIPAQGKQLQHMQAINHTFQISQTGLFTNLSFWVFLMN